MLKKILAIFSLLSLVFFASPVLAENSNSQSRQFKLPDSAVKISDNLYSLGTARDPKTGKQVEGFAIIHYKNSDSKTGNAKAGKTACYGFLATGAKWKTNEPWVVNPQNSRGLPSDFLLNNLSYNISKWEDAADGRVGNSLGIDILGNGATTSADLSSGAGTLNGANEVYFADIADPNVIAVTTIWGIYSGPIEQRELVEWDQVYDDVDFDWSASGEAGKMDFENLSTHELGHSVGMADLYNSACYLETMYGYASLGQTIKRTLEKGDINGINLLY